MAAEASVLAMVSDDVGLDRGSADAPCADLTQKVFLRLCGWWVTAEEHNISAGEAKGAGDKSCSFPGCIYREKHHGPHGFDEATLAQPTPKRSAGVPNKFTTALLSEKAPSPAAAAQPAASRKVKRDPSPFAGKKRPAVPSPSLPAAPAPAAAASAAAACAGTKVAFRSSPATAWAIAATAAAAGEGPWPSNDSWSQADSAAEPAAGASSSAGANAAAGVAGSSSADSAINGSASSHAAGSGAAAPQPAPTQPQALGPESVAWQAKWQQFRDRQAAAATTKPRPPPKAPHPDPGKQHAASSSSDAAVAAPEGQWSDAPKPNPLAVAAAKAKAKAAAARAEPNPTPAVQWAKVKLLEPKASPQHLAKPKPKLTANVDDRAEDSCEDTSSAEGGESRHPRVYVKLNGWWETPETLRRNRLWALEGMCNFPGCPLADRHSGPHQYDEEAIELFKN